MSFSPLALSQLLQFSSVPPICKGLSSLRVLLGFSHCQESPTTPPLTGLPSFGNFDSFSFFTSQLPASKSLVRILLKRRGEGVRGKEKKGEERSKEAPGARLGHTHTYVLERRERSIQEEQRKIRR
jgi:hypothetical protein